MKKLIKFVKNFLKKWDNIQIILKLKLILMIKKDK